MRYTNVFRSICLLLVFLAAPAWSDTVSGTLSWEFDLSSHDKNQETKLWIPYPVSGPHQDITGVSVKGDYAESAVYTDATHQTPMLFARWDAGSTSRKLSFVFNVDRKAVTRGELPATDSGWDPADYALYLKGTRLGPVDGDVKKLADKITAGKTTMTEKAKAIYDWTCENTYRNPDTRGCGSGDVCTLLKDPGGKCGDLSSIFIALLRASGIPAREIFGIRQGKTKDHDISTWQHCWAEFFLPGAGWIPADPADVRKMMLKHKLTLKDAKTDAYRDFFWGGIDARRVQLGKGRDLTLNPRQKGLPVNYLMYPFAEVGEKTLDWLDPKTFRYTITYQPR